MCQLSIADWVRESPTPIAASLYALPQALRVSGAELAHQAGCRIHADVILTTVDGQPANVGVSTDCLAEVAERVPDAGLEVHLMVLAEFVDWEPAVRQIVLDLVGVPVARWLGRPEILRVVETDAEGWIEVWPPRDEFPAVEAASGVLVMLIEPGTQQRATPELIEAARRAYPDRRIGLDGGITREIAYRASRAGIEYLVAGRALFGPKSTVN